MRRFESHDNINEVAEPNKFRPIVNFCTYGFFETLSTIAECLSTKPESDCLPLLLIRSLEIVLSFDRLEIVLLCTLWNTILTKVNIVSKALQELCIEKYTAVKLLR